MNIKSLIPILVIIALATLYVFYAPASIETANTVSFAGEEISVEVADNSLSRNKGLSGREVLDSGSGMFFIFEEEGQYRFWMKDMNFPIDILWFNAEKELVDVTLNVSPDTYPEHFTSGDPAKYVLETNHGEFLNLRQSLGEKFELSTRKSDD